MSDIIDSIIGFVTNPFGIFDSSSKKGRMMSLGNAPVPVNYPIFLQTDANGNISTFDFETQNFKALKISGDITSNGNLTVTGDVSGNSVVLNNNNNSVGSISLNKGNGDNAGKNAGFINFNYKDGKRKAYLGYDDLNNNMIAFEGENGCNGLHIKGANANLTVDGITETKLLNIKTNNPSGATHLNWTDGKNYLTGETIVRGGILSCDNKIIQLGRWKIDASDDHLRFKFDDQQKYVMTNPSNSEGFWSEPNGGYLKFNKLHEAIRGMSVHLQAQNIVGAGNHGALSL